MIADPKLVHPKPVIEDPKKRYDVKKGGDFLVGFLYGVGIGYLDEEKVY